MSNILLHHYAALGLSPVAKHPPCLHQLKDEAGKQDPPLCLETAMGEEAHEAYSAVVLFGVMDDIGPHVLCSPSMLSTSGFSLQEYAVHYPIQKFQVYNRNSRLKFKQQQQFHSCRSHRNY